MTRPRTPTSALAPALALAVLVAGGLAAPTALAGWWDEAGAARPTTLVELRAAPEKWRDVPVVLEVRFESLAGRFNPYFTQFNPMTWQAVTVTPDVEDGARRETFSHVFVRRGSAGDERLRELRGPTRLLLRAVVRDTVGGEPWLEVLRVTGDGDPLTPEESAQVRQAQRFLDKSNPAAAEGLLLGVLSARRLPIADRARLHRALGVALYEQRRLEDALMAFRAAMELDPRDHTAASSAARIETALATPRAAPPPRTARAARPAPEPPAALRKPLFLPASSPRRLAPPAGLTGPGESSTIPVSHAPAQELTWPTAPETGALARPEAAPPTDAWPAPPGRASPPLAERSAEGPATRLPVPPRRPAPAVTPPRAPPAPAVRRAPAPRPRTLPAPAPRSGPSPAARRPAPETPEEEPPAPLPPRPGLAGPK